MESTLDFQDISNKLDTLVDNQLKQHKQKRSELLDKIRPALLNAREKKVPLVILTAFLKDNGIPVSVPTLRSYLNTLPGGKKVHKRRRKKLLINQNHTPIETLPQRN